jgi:hypothetical protein
MRKIIILLFILLNNYLFGKSFVVPDYFTQIIKTEQLFIEGDLIKSIKEYKNIFRNQHNYFPHDTYIATQISCLLGDTASVRIFINYGIVKGIDTNAYLEDYNINLLFKNYPNFRNTIFIEFNLLYSKYLHNIDILTKYEIDAITSRDMLYHELPYELRDKYSKDEIYGKILDENTNKFIEIVKKVGFTGIHKIGIKNNRLDKTCLSATQYKYEMNEPCDLIFFHHQCAYFNLIPELDIALAKGEIHPRMFAHYYEWAYGAIKNIGDTAGFEVVNDETGEIEIFHKNQTKRMKCMTNDKQIKEYRIYKGRYFENNSEKAIALVNKCRAEIGIASLQHDSKKHSFAEKNKLTLFFGMFGEL